MTTLFLLLVLITSIQSFVFPLLPACNRQGPLQQQQQQQKQQQKQKRQHVAASNNLHLASESRFNSLLLTCSLPNQNTYDDAPLLALNESSSRIDAMALAESKKPVGAYQITRPRWYNKAEAAVIVLLVQRLRLLDVRGVEHMLEATDDFRKEDPVCTRKMHAVDACYMSLRHCSPSMLGIPSCNIHTTIYLVKSLPGIG